MSYQRIFDDAVGAAPPSRVDVEQVIRRERRAAVLRPVLAAAVAVVLVATGAFAAAAVVARSDQAVPPAENTVDGFDEYHEGTRVIAADSGRLTETLEFTFTPSTRDLALRWRCDSPPPWWHSIIGVGDHRVYLERAEVRVDGELLSGVEGDVGCRQNSSDLLMVGDAEHWADRGVVVGEPVTVTAAIVGAITDVDGKSIDAPRRAEWGVAVAEPVPFEQYAFPPRPDPLPPIREPSQQCPYSARLRSDPNDPDRQLETTLPLRRHGVTLLAQTPGFATVTVDGVEVGRAEQWTYDGGGGLTGLTLDPEALRDAGLSAWPGDSVTLTVEPAHMTGDWLVLIGPPGYFCG